MALVPCRAISEDGGFEGAARDDAREPDAFFSSADWLRGNESCALCGGTGRKACGQVRLFRHRWLGGDAPRGGRRRPRCAMHACMHGPRLVSSTRVLKARDRLYKAMQRCAARWLVEVLRRWPRTETRSVASISRV